MYLFSLFSFNFDKIIMELFTIKLLFTIIIQSELFFFGKFGAGEVSNR